MTATTPRSLPRLVITLLSALIMSILASVTITPPALAGTVDGQVRLGAFTPLTTAPAFAPKHLSAAIASCKLPSSRDISGYGDFMQYTEVPSVTFRQDVGQDTFYSYRPTRIGNDLNWYLSPYIGGAYLARVQAVVKFVDLNNVCRTGTMLVQYGVKVTNVKGIDPTARLIRAVFTKRANWKYLVGAEISVLPLRTTQGYSAEWQRAGNRAMVSPLRSRFVEHASPTMLPQTNGTTKLMAVVAPHFRVRIQARYVDSFGRVHTTARSTYGLCGGNKILAVPVPYTRVTVTLMEGVTC